MVMLQSPSVRYGSIIVAFSLLLFSLPINRSNNHVVTLNGCGLYNVFLPLMMSSAEPIYFEGPWENELNNSYDRANGPIRSGVDYYGYPDDRKDYYSFYLPIDGAIDIHLFGNLGQGVQLQLFYESLLNPIDDYDFSPPYQINHNGKAGWYYVFIFKESGFNSNAPYTLRATYPNQSSSLTYRSSNSISSSNIPSIDASWIGYNFEESIEDWVTSEGAYKLASLSTSAQQAYQSFQSLKLTTELCGQTDFLYRHTEATAYFTSAVPQGINTLGPYDLTDHQVSCYVYLPSDLAPKGDPQAYVRIFVKDDQFRNQYSDLINITDINTEKWTKLSLAIGNHNADPNFDSTRINTLGLRFELYNDATLNFVGDIFIDECSISSNSP